MNGHLPGTVTSRGLKAAKRDGIIRVSCCRIFACPSEELRIDIERDRSRPAKGTQGFDPFTRDARTNPYRDHAAAGRQGNP